MREFERYYDDYDVVEGYNDGIASAEDLFDPYFVEPAIEIDDRVIPRETEEYQKQVSRASELDKSDEQDIINELCDYDTTPARVAEIKQLLLLSNARLAQWFVRQTMGIDGSKREIVDDGEALISITTSEHKKAKGKFIPYFHYLASNDCDYDDRLQLSYEAMLKSIDAYEKNANPTKKLSTKMVQSMESHAMNKFDEFNQIGYIPSYRRLLINRLLRQIHASENAGYLPNINRLAFMEPEANVWRIEDELARYLMFQNISTEDYEAHLDQSMVDDYSGDYTEEDLSLSDFVADESTVGLDNYIIDDIVFFETIKRVMTGLSDKEYSVVDLRFGLSSGEPVTLAEIGDILGLTRGRIGQIEAKVLSDIRKSNLGRVLRELMTESKLEVHSSASSFAPAPFGLEERLGLDSLTKFDRSPVSISGFGNTSSKKFVYQEDWSDDDLAS
jgi:hypothetical protein